MRPSSLKVTRCSATSYLAKESRRAKASLKEAEARETETPEDRRKAEQLLAIYHDEDDALKRPETGSAAAPGDEALLCIPWIKTI